MQAAQEARPSPGDPVPLFLGDKSAPTRLTFIDSLRGCAALAVVFYHAAEGGHLRELAALLPGAAALLSRGHLGVQVFFVLSGFVVALALSGKKVNGPFVGRFILRRSLRLDPPYWASMILVIAFGLVSAQVVPGKVYELPSLGVIAGHMAYLPLLLNQPLVSSVYWTLCLEFQFYLVYVALLWLAAGMRSRASAETSFAWVFLPALAFADLWAVGWGPLNVPGLFLGHWFYFLTGVVVWWALYSKAPAARMGALAQLSLLLVTAIFRNDDALFVTFGTALAIYMAGRRGQLCSWLSARPFLFLGAISYSLYLTHNPVTGAAYRLGFSLLGRSPATELLCSMAVIAVCIGAAAIFYRLVELPALRWSQRIGQRARPASDAIASMRVT